MTFPAPHIHHQLDKSKTQGADCGPCATATAIDYESRGKIRMNQHDVRKIMFIPKGPTGTPDAGAAIMSLGGQFVAAGLHAPNWQPMLFGSWEDDLRPALEHGRGVLLVVSYAIINGRRWHRLSGDRFFSGNHILFAYGFHPHGRGQDATTTVYDSLDDGRKRGNWTAPKGPIEWPLPALRVSAGHAWVKFADGSHGPVGRGRFAGGIVRRVKDWPA